MGKPDERASIDLGLGGRWRLALLAAAVGISGLSVIGCSRANDEAGETSAIAALTAVPGTYNVRFRLTSVTPGDGIQGFTDEGVEVTTGAMLTSLAGVAAPPTPGFPFFDCANSGTQFATGCATNVPTEYYPDPTKAPGDTCPGLAPAFGSCVEFVSFSPIAPGNAAWLSQFYAVSPPDGSTTVPLVVTFQHLEDFYSQLISNGNEDASTITLNVDLTTGVVTPVPVVNDAFLTGINNNCAILGKFGVGPGHNPGSICFTVDVTPGTMPPATPYPPYPWDLEFYPNPMIEARDANGLRLNPQWNWQTTTQPPLGWDECVDDGIPSRPCTHESTEINAPTGGVLPAGDAYPFSCGVPVIDAFGGGKGHENWEAVTYQGPVFWEGHSNSITQDDDFNINIHPPTTINGTFAGVTVGDLNEVHMEYSASEVNPAIGTLPYWASFVDQAIAGSTNPQGVNGTDAIAIGLLGVDREHDSKAELHPLFALALHTKSDDLTDDIWDMFARDFGNEGLCSDHEENLTTPDGKPVNLKIELPRPAGADPTIDPTVVTECTLGGAVLTVPQVRFRMASANLGSFTDQDPAAVVMDMETHFNGAPVPVGGVATPVFWCDDNNPAASAGVCFLSSQGTAWAYPDPATRACPPTGSGPNVRCAGAAPDASWMRSTFVDASSATMRIDVIFHVLLGLFENTLGVDMADVPFTLNVDQTSGAVTASTSDSVHIKQLTSDCVTLKTGAQGGNDPTFCWKVEILQPPPSPNPPFGVDIAHAAGTPNDAGASNGPPVTVTYSLPIATAYGCEVRINWKNTTPPAPVSQPLTATSQVIAASPSTDGLEDTLASLGSQLTPQQLSVYSAFQVPYPTLPAGTPATVNIHSGPPPATTDSLMVVPGTQPAAIEEHLLGVQRGLCAALGGQIPGATGSCAVFPPVTQLTNSGTPGANGWFTSPVTITLTATDVGGSGIDHTEYSLDGGVTWTRYTAPFVAPEGAIAISYRSVDKNGQSETYQQAQFKIDTHPPSSTVTANIQVEPIVLSFTVTDPTPGSGPAGIHTISQVGNTSQLDTRFTPGASGTVQLNTQCTNVEYWGEDVAGNQETPHKHLTDSSPPELSVPPNVTTSICTTSATVQVGQATATDECLSSVPLTGKVIATNGTTLGVPIPVVGGAATLGLGVHTVQWSASDGFHTVTGTQTVTVGPRIETASSFTVEDRASVVADGGFGAVLNAGTGTAQIGNDSKSGTVMSVGPISVLHRAVVTGDAVSGSTVSKATDGTITGTTRQNASVVLPVLGTLPSFPSPTAGSFTVSSGTVTKNPGSYTTASVTGGTLVLKSGDYYFQSLTINANVTVRATSTTRVFVRNTLTFQSPIRATTGTAIQPLFVGFAGSTVTLEAELDGTFLAPSANVGFGVDTSITFTGSYFARAIDIRPASVLHCR